MKTSGFLHKKERNIPIMVIIEHFCRFLDYCAIFFCCLMTSTDSPAISQGTLALSHLHSYKTKYNYNNNNQICT